MADRRAKAAHVDSGFRLMRLEVMHWGTFREGVASLHADGRNTMLTGNFGAGASTLLDALRTLLMPPQRVAMTSPGPDRPAIALGVFHNAGLDRTVALAQIVWSPGAQAPVARLFVAAPHALSIAADLAHFDGDLLAIRKSLRAAGAEVFDTLARHDAWFRRCFAIGDLVPVDVLRTCRDALDGYFAGQKLALIDARLARLAEDWARHDRRTRDEMERHAALTAQALHLRHSISSSGSGGERIAQLDIEIDQLERGRDQRRRRAALYATLAAVVNEAPAENELDFAAQRHRLADTRPVAEARSAAQAAARAQLAAISDFGEIDWRPLAREAARLGDEKQRLQCASALVQQLADGLDELRETIRDCEEELDACRDARAAAQTTISLADAQRQQTADQFATWSASLETIPQGVLDTLHAEYAAREHELTVESCDARREAMRRWLDARIAADADDWAQLAEQLRNGPDALALAAGTGTGHDHERPLRFRLAVIDSGFWQGADAATCNELQRLTARDIQWWIVTPPQKIPIVEPMVSRVAVLHEAEDGASQLWQIAMEPCSVEEAAMPH